jgi:hypothetical protein
MAFKDVHCRLLLIYSEPFIIDNDVRRVKLDPTNSFLLSNGYMTLSSSLKSHKIEYAITLKGRWQTFLTIKGVLKPYASS